MSSSEATVTDVPRPLRRDAELNRQRILQAGRQVFAVRGLDATLNDIAHFAGLGVGTVYRRFPSKEALVESLFVDRLREVQARAQEALVDPDCWGGLQSFMVWMTATVAEDRGLYEVSVGGAYGREAVATARDEMCSRVGALIERAEREGAVRPGASGTDVLAFMVMLGAVVEYSRSVRPELWRRYLDIFLDGLRAVPQGRPSPDVAALSEAELARVVYGEPHRTA